MTKKLLIIDDNSTQLNILKILFTNDGWEVRGVQSAKIGFEMIFDFAPDLIVTDAIMPLLGGFQLIKLIRENKFISKIPVIVYSVLNEMNAKFYMKEEYSEYFLRKDDNHDKLLALAHSVTDKFPISDEYKEAIIEESLERYKNSQPQEKVEVEEIPKEVVEEIVEQQEEVVEETVEEKHINIDEIKKLVNELDYQLSDERLITTLFAKLYKELGYELGVLDIYSFDDKEKKLYFDIRNIILSPILRNVLLNKYQTQTKISYKQYAPNMDMIVNESEFVSKIEFDFNYKDDVIGSIAFYSREKAIWENQEELDLVKEILYEFFKKRIIQRYSLMNKSEKLTMKYQVSNSQFEDIKTGSNAYFAIMQIVNFSDLSTLLSEQEIDILNSKISEKLIECIDKNEQVFRNDEDEYDIVLFVKDEKQVRNRLQYICKQIEEIKYSGNEMQIFIGASNCMIEGSFNIVDAQKNARKVLEEANYSEKVVIYNE